jgi:hypothetical protein
MAQTPRDIGALVKLASSITPVASDDATVNGTSTDRMVSGSGEGYLSCVLHCAVGTATNMNSVDCKLQESANDSDFTDISGAAITQITATETDAEVDVDLSGAERYVRAVATVDGTDVHVGATIAFGGAITKPAS